MADRPENSIWAFLLDCTWMGLISCFINTIHTAEAPNIPFMWHLLPNLPSRSEESNLYTLSETGGFRSVSMVR